MRIFTQANFRKCAMALCAIFLSSIAKNELTAQAGFQKKFDDIWIAGMIPTADGGFILSGWNSGSGEEQGGVLIKLDETGDTMWTRFMLDTIWCLYHAVDQTEDGGYILVGRRYRTYERTDILLTRTNADGSIRWVKRLATDLYENGRDVLETADGGFIITGELTRDTLGLHNDVFITKTDENGEVIWTKTYHGPGDTQGFRILKLENEDIIVHGVINIGTENPDILTMRLDAEGEIIWSRSYGGPDYDRSYTLMLTGQQHLAVAGLSDSYSTGYGDSYITLLDLDGNLLWSKSYGNTGGDQANAIAETSDGGFIFGGNSLGSFEPDGSRYVLRTNQTGEVLWSMSYWDGDSDDITGIFELESGDFLVTGHQENFMKLSAQGDMGCHQKIAPTITIDAPTQFYNHPISIHPITIPSVPHSLTEIRGLNIYQTCETTISNSPVESVYVEIYPNPSSDVVYMHSPDNPILQIQLTDISGRLVRFKSTQAEILSEILVADLPTGVYILRIETAKGWVSQKLIR